MTTKDFDYIHDCIIQYAEEYSRGICFITNALFLSDDTKFLASRRDISIYGSAEDKMILTGDISYELKIQFMKAYNSAFPHVTEEKEETET